jgi:hypothetical protein
MTHNLFLDSLSLCLGGSHGSSEWGTLRKEVIKRVQTSRGAAEDLMELWSLWAPATLFLTTCSFFSCYKGQDFLQVWVQVPLQWLDWLLATLPGNGPVTFSPLACMMRPMQPPQEQEGWWTGRKMWPAHPVIPTMSTLFLSSFEILDLT